MRFFRVAENNEESEEETRQKMAEAKENGFCRFCKNAAIVEEKGKGGKSKEGRHLAKTSEFGNRYMRVCSQNGE